MRTRWTAAIALGSSAEFLLACGGRTGLGVFERARGRRPADGQRRRVEQRRRELVEQRPAQKLVELGRRGHSGLPGPGARVGTPAVPPRGAAPAPGCAPELRGRLRGYLEQRGGRILHPRPRSRRAAPILGFIDVQIATYKAPDHLRITSGVDTEPTPCTCSSTRATCRPRPTAIRANGCLRPPDDSIRQYQVVVKAGTRSLTFDVSGGCAWRGTCACSVSAIWRWQRRSRGASSGSMQRTAAAWARRPASRGRSAPGSRKGERMGYPPLAGTRAHPPPRRDDVRLERSPNPDVTGETH